METTKPKHKLFDHPYLGAIVAGTLVFVGASVLGLIPEFVLGVIKTLNGERSADAPMMGAASFIFTGIFSLAALLIHRRWFRKDGYKGCFTNSKGRNRDVRMWLLILLAADIIFFFVEALASGGEGVKIVPPTVMSFAVSFYAGTCEETSFRAIPVSIMMKNSPSRKRMWAAVILSAIAFGIVHMGNVTSGATAATSFSQSMAAVCIGVFFAAVYIRTGNILFTMVYHFLHDIISMMDPMQSTGIMLQTSFSAVNKVCDCIFCVLCVATAIFLLRGSKWEEIKATWANIWNEQV